ncbi:nuclear transport factor 2 family protein [Sphingorhabdus sp. Alg231-15]|uniref:nuclear transport factor 2 family protein n=1 Tax=Sphingorhabdus sp. Alg231-15 TaxID=1922222 RepID=UPI00307C6F48
MMTNQPDQFSSFSGLLREALDDFLVPDAETFLDMVADDIVMEFPYAPPAAVPRVEGKAALVEYLPGAASLITIESMSEPVVHRAQNSNIIILEFTCTGHGTETGIAYDQTYISVVTLADGHITHYRDYWNPLIALRAMGGDDAIAAALKEADNA